MSSENYGLHPGLAGILRERDTLRLETTQLKAELLRLRREIKYPTFVEGTPVRDQVWGDVSLTRLASELISHPTFRRLRGIKQLGFISEVWPGGSHTRFQHSIGVYHLARQGLQTLLVDNRIGDISPAEVDTFLAAALLHDLGHYPFTRAIDGLRGPYELQPDEKIAADIITNPALSRVSAREQQATIPETLEKHGVDPKRVASLIGTPEEEQPGSLNVLKKLLNGALDVDKLDYLVRDSQNCNVPYGYVDVSRLLQSLTVEGNKLAITEKGLGAFQSLLFAKYLMFHNVYWHRTARALTVMFARAIQDLLDTDAKINVHDLINYDDIGAIAMLKSRAKGGPHLKRKTTSLELLEEVEYRYVYRRSLEVAEVEKEHPKIFELADKLGDDPRKRKEIEIKLSKKLGEKLNVAARGHEILIDVPQKEIFEYDLPIVRRGNLDGVDGRETQWAQMVGLTVDELGRYSKYIRRIRFFARDEAFADCLLQNPGLFYDAL